MVRRLWRTPSARRWTEFLLLASASDRAEVGRLIKNQEHTAGRTTIQDFSKFTQSAFVQANVLFAFAPSKMDIRLSEFGLLRSLTPRQTRIDIFDNRLYFCKGIDNVVRASIEEYLTRFFKSRLYFLGRHVISLVK